MVTTTNNAVMILPERDPRDIGSKSAAKQLTITLPEWMMARIEALGPPTGYTRNDFVREAVRRLVDEIDSAQPTKKSPK